VEFETAAAMRLQREGLKQAMYGGFGKPADAGGESDAPVGSAGWLPGECSFQQGRNSLVTDSARPARSQFVIQARQAVVDKALPPFAHGGFRPVQATPQSGCCFAPPPTTTPIGRGRPKGEARCGNGPMPRSCVCSSEISLRVGFGRPVRIRCSVTQSHYLL
jgi:hypothetical protein